MRFSVTTLKCKH